MTNSWVAALAVVCAVADCSPIEQNVVTIIIATAAVLATTECRSSASAAGEMGLDVPVIRLDMLNVMHLLFVAGSIVGAITVPRF